MQLKKILLGIGFGMMSSVAIAQQSSAPPPADVSIPQPGLVYPLYSAPVTQSLQPTLDAASYTYLRWMGSNVQLLVNYANFFYQLQKSEGDIGSGAYMAPTTALVNNYLIAARAGTITASTLATIKNVGYLLSPDDDSTLSAAKYVMVPGTDIKSPDANNIAFNANTIIGSFGYEDKINDDIGNLIMFLTGAAKPLGGLTFSKDADERKKQLQGADVQNYLLAARTASTGQSVAFSNLNYLAQERRIVPGVGQAAGMTTLPTDGSQKPVADASQLQLEEFMVNRRVGNKSWYTNMNTASSIAVQRETLFVLAEMEKQLFEQKILLERMLTEQVAIQEQQAQLNRTKLDYDRQNVQQQLSSSAS